MEQRCVKFRLCYADKRMATMTNWISGQYTIAQIDHQPCKLVHMQIQLPITLQQNHRK